MVTLRWYGVLYSYSFRLTCDFIPSFLHRFLYFYFCEKAVTSQSATPHQCLLRTDLSLCCEFLLQPCFPNVDCKKLHCWWLVVYCLLPAKHHSYLKKLKRIECPSGGKVLHAFVICAQECFDSTPVGLIPPRSAIYCYFVSLYIYLFINSRHRRWSLQLCTILKGRTKIIVRAPGPKESSFKTL